MKLALPLGIIVLSAGLGLASYWLGSIHGRQFGYAVCVSEEDDDYVRERRF